MADILCLREESHTSKEFRNYSVEELIDKVDCVLAEHGFAMGKEKCDRKRNYRYNVYESLEGWAVVKFVEDKSQLIQLISEKSVIARCPVYVELRNVSPEITESIKRDVSKI